MIWWNEIVMEVFYLITSLSPHVLSFRLIATQLRQQPLTILQQLGMVPPGCPDDLNTLSHYHSSLRSGM